MSVRVQSHSGRRQLCPFSKQLATRRSRGLGVPRMVGSQASRLSPGRAPSQAQGGPGRPSAPPRTDLGPRHMVLGPQSLLPPETTHGLSDVPSPSGVHQEPGFALSQSRSDILIEAQASRLRRHGSAPSGGEPQRRGCSRWVHGNDQCSCVLGLSTSTPAWPHGLSPHHLLPRASIVQVGPYPCGSQIFLF